MTDRTKDASCRTAESGRKARWETPKVTVMAAHGAEAGAGIFPDGPYPPS